MLRLIKLLITTIGFLQIVIGPMIAGVLIGSVIYNNKTDATGLVIAIIIAILGLIGGIVWAVRVAKKQNPADYVSQIRASTDLNEKN